MESRRGLFHTHFFLFCFLYRTLYFILSEYWIKIYYCYSFMACCWAIKRLNLNVLSLLCFSYKQTDIVFKERIKKRRAALLNNKEKIKSVERKIIHSNKKIWIFILAARVKIFSFTNHFSFYIYRLYNFFKLDINLDNFTLNFIIMMNG